MLQQQNMCQIMASQQNSFLYTVSRLVSSRDIRRRGSEEEGGRLLHVTDPDPTVKPKHIPKPPILETLFYIHLIALFAILSMCWIDTLPGIGRVCSYWYIIRSNIFIGMKKFSTWNFSPILFLNIELVKSNKGSRMMLSKIIVAFEEMNT